MLLLCTFVKINCIKFIFHIAWGRVKVSCYVYPNMTEIIKEYIGGQLNVQENVERFVSTGNICYD